MSEAHATDLAEEVVEEAIDEIEEKEETTDAVEEDLAESEDDAEESEDDEPEMEEFNFGGDKMEVPKGTIPDDVAARLREFTEGTWQAATKRNQEVAEKSKAIEAREGAIERLETLNGDALEKFAKGLALQQEIEQLRNIDLNELWQSDQDQARRVSDHISQKQAEFQNISGEVAKAEQEFTKARQEETTRRIEEGKQLVERQIKGFNDKAPEVIEYATKNGVSKEDAELWAVNPVTAIFAYKAMMFDRMQAKAKKPAPKKSAAPVTPMKTKGTGGGRAFDPVRDADKMPMDQWVKQENARLRKKAGI